MRRRGRRIVPVGRAIGALGRLLAGHLKRYRRTELQTIAAELYASEGPAAYLTRALVNGTLAVRRAVYVHAVITCMQLASRVRYAVARPALQPGAARSMSLLCPTRGRPSNVQAFVRSVVRTAAMPSRVEILFYIDEDDPEKARYLEWFRRYEATGSPVRCIPIVGEPMSVSRSWNVIAKACSGDLLMMANDDQMYVDYAWDLRIDVECDRFPDGIVCMYFDNARYEAKKVEGFPKGDFPIVTRRWYEMLGYFTPGIFEFSGNDQWILDVARRAGRLHAIPGVFMEHLHYDAYKSPFDETYRRHRQTWHKAIRDLTTYLDTAADRSRTADRLKAAAAAGAHSRNPSPEAR